MASDFVAPPSQSPNLAIGDLAQPALQTPQSLDQQFGTMNQIEQGWSLPQLPDQVKLDLLANPSLPDAQAMSNFLHGIHSDMRIASSPPGDPLAQTGQPATANPFTNATDQQVGQAVTTPQPTPQPGVMFQPVDSVDNQLRRIWHGVAGLRSPEVISGNAVTDLKAKAIAAGLLPANTPVDGSWDPALNSVRVQLMNKDFASAINGNRPGAMSPTSIMGLIGKWTSPSGLLQAAVGMNFLPDLNKLGKDLGNWGNSLSAFAAHPFSAHNIANVLSPVLDVGLPVLNDALLFSGVSEVVAFSRGAMLAGDLAEGASLADAIGQGGSILGRQVGTEGLGRFGINAMDVSNEVDKFQQAGHIASRLQQTSGLGQGAGDLMAGWRQQTGVMIAKKAIQQGMKLGIAAQLENVGDPTFSGVGINGVGIQKDRIQQFRQGINGNPLTQGLSMALDIPFAPPNVFKPGLASGAAKDFASTVKDALTSVSKDQQLSGAYYNTALQYLSATDPAKFDQFQQVAQKAGPQAALVGLLGNGDAAKAGQIMDYVTTSAGVDKAAREIASGYTDLQPGSRGFSDLVNVQKNKMFAQLRSVPVVGDDLENAEQFATRMGRMDLTGGTPGAIKDSQKAATADWMQRFNDPAQQQDAIAEARQIAADHTDLIRRGTKANVLNSLTPEDLATYLFKTFDRVGADTWDSYNSALHSLQEFTIGQDLSSLAPKDMQSWVPEPLQGVIQNDKVDPKLLSGKLFDRFGGEIDPNQKAFTLMRTNEVSRQQAFALHAYTSGLLQHQAALSDFQDSGEFQDVSRTLLAKLVGADATTATSTDLQAGQSLLQSMSNNALKEATKGIAPDMAMSQKKLRGIGQAMQWAANNGADPNETIGFLNDQLRAINGSEVWAGRLNIPGNLSIEDKLAALGQKAGQLAAEVSLPADQAQHLANAGYKAVYGTDFLMPKDLADIQDPMRPLENSTFRRMTLGTFMTAHDNATLTDLRERNLRSALVGVLSQAKDETGTPLLSGGVTDPNNADVSSVFNMLQERRQQIAENMAAVANDAEKGSTRTKIFNRVMNTGAVPMSIYDMPSKQVHDLFDGTYGVKTAENIVASLAKAKDIGWEYQGLQGIESKLVGNSWLRGSLRAFGASSAADDMNTFTGFQREGVGPLSGVRALAPKLALGAVAGMAAANTQDDMGKKLLAGAAAGVGAATVSKPTAQFLMNRLDGANWGEYSKLGRSLMDLRDKLRFSLNPFFDLQRYSHGMMLAATARDLPEGVSMPLNPTLGGLGVKGFRWGGFGGQEADDAMNGFRAAAGHWIDTDAIESTQKFFTEKGILGYSPTKWMAGSWQHLVDQGMGEKEAADYVRNLYSYGLHGRSGLEMSTNFLMFPFSFQKKVLGQLAGFMGDDLGRAVVMHDAFKTYEMLNQRYDLNKQLADHLPILGQMSKFNMLANGIGTGELGGVNRPILNAISASPIASEGIDPILNLFLPQAYQIHNKTDAAMIQKMGVRMAPALRDVGHLWDNMKEQGNVLFSPSHMTTSNQVDSAYREWNAFKDQVGTFAKGQGLTFSQLLRDPQYAPMKTFIDQKQRDIESKYPAWMQAKANATQNAIQTQAQKGEILADPTTPGEHTMAEFDGLISKLQDAIQKNTGSSLTNNPELLPGPAYDAVRNYAIELAKRNDGFASLYRQYYMKQFGPIHMELT